MSATARIWTSRSLPPGLENDLYQLTMAYGYWKAGKHLEPAVFEYFYRRPPFGGEFAIFAGLADLLDFVRNFRFTDEMIERLQKGTLRTHEEEIADFEAKLFWGTVRKTGGGYEELRVGIGRTSDNETWLPKKYPDGPRWIPGELAGCDQDFFAWLKSVDFSSLDIWAMGEGTVVFPGEPIVRVKGPIALGQLLETPLLYALNFPTLIATNAVRYRLAAGPEKVLLEFGLRRAQSGDRASYYAWLGGFDGTSNVAAAERLGITAAGTMAHSFIESFTGLGDIKNPMMKDTHGNEVNFVELVLKYRTKLRYEETNEGELAAMISFAMAFPNRFLAILDTYNTLKSGTPNFICVARALKELGYKPVGGRIDSGDLAYLSREVRRLFVESDELCEESMLAKAAIVASNDIDEATIRSFEEDKQQHSITHMGIGTHLVTCSTQPSLGGVYKLVEFGGRPRIKLSADSAKTTIPGGKAVYRLYLANGEAYDDLMVAADAPAPEVGKSVLCRDPFVETKRVKVVPSAVEALHHLVWHGGRVSPLPPPVDVRSYVWRGLAKIRPDHLRVKNPTPYKVSVDEALYVKLHELLLGESSVEVVR